MCPTPLKNFEEPAPNPEYVQAVENYETWLADVDAHFGAGSANKIVSLFCAWEKLKEF
jgi:hypothetical protein